MTLNSNSATSLFSKARLFIPRGAILGAICGAVAFGIGSFSSMRLLEEWAYDWCFSTRENRTGKSLDQIVLIGIDDRSLDSLKIPMIEMSPQLAKVVTFLKDSGAKVVGVDLMMPHANDPRFGAEAMGKSVDDAENVVLAVALVADDNGKLRFLRSTHWWKDPADNDGVGVVNLDDDDDHFIRKQRSFYSDSDGETVLPQFDVALWSRATGNDPQSAPENLRINYAGPPGTFHTVSFRKVLETIENQGGKSGWGRKRFQDKIVLIGVTARTQQDRHATPYSNRAFHVAPKLGAEMMAGVEIHANILSTLLDDAFFREVPPLGSPAILVVAGSLLGMASARLNLAGGVGLMLAHHFAWKAIARECFAWGSLRLPIVPMLIVGFLVFPTTFAIRWWWLRRMFGIVKSRAIVKAIESKKLDSQGEARELTVLFSDIRGFTAYSANKPPHQVVALLNEYFSVMVPIVERHGGTIDKFIGDGLMVLFGAPDPLPDHATRAVSAAVEMIRQTRGLRDDWSRLYDFPGFAVGVGIQSGPAIVGPIGSSSRLDFTAIGDTVNTAARLETANKEPHYSKPPAAEQVDLHPAPNPEPSEILIGSRTFERLQDQDITDLHVDPTPRYVHLKGLDWVQIHRVYP